MFPEPSMIETNGIRMAVYEQGEGSAVVMLHGFPELAFSWRHQLPALAAAGFRAIAPDQRGYGETDVPPDVSDYRIEELIEQKVMKLPLPAELGEAPIWNPKKPLFRKKPVGKQKLSSKRKPSDTQADRPLFQSRPGGKPYPRSRRILKGMDGEIDQLLIR